MFVVLIFWCLPFVIAYATLGSPIGGYITWWHAAICGALSTIAFFPLWRRNNCGIAMFLAGVVNSLAIASWLVICWRLIELNCWTLDFAVVPFGTILLLAGALIYPLIGTGMAEKRAAS
jgi:hypothetical protein